MNLTDEGIRHVARLARLRMKSEDLSSTRESLNRVLEYVEQIRQLDLREVAPTMHVAGIEMPLRPDRVEDSLAVDAALKNAPRAAGNMFQVPRIMDGGDS